MAQEGSGSMKYETVFQRMRHLYSLCYCLHLHLLLLFMMCRSVVVVVAYMCYVAWLASIYMHI